MGIHRRVHLERPQPAKRARLGYLEKHKDFVHRAKDFNKKKEKIRRLNEQAYYRNKDEFSLKMLQYEHDEEEEGRIRKKVSPLTEDQQRLADTQDVRYISGREQMDRKAIERMRENLHFLQTDKGNKHIIYLDDDDIIENKSKAEKAKVKSDVAMGGSVPAVPKAVPGGSLTSSAIYKGTVEKYIKNKCGILKCAETFKIYGKNVIVHGALCNAYFYAGQEVVFGLAQEEAYASWIIPASLEGSKGYRGTLRDFGIVECEETFAQFKCDVQCNRLRNGSHRWQHIAKVGDEVVFGVNVDENGVPLVLWMRPLLEQDKVEISVVKPRKKKLGLKDYDLAEHFDTHPSLLKCSWNRPLKKQLETMDLNFNYRLATKNRVAYDELLQRTNRMKRLRRVREELELRRHLASKEKRELVKEATQDHPAVYKFLTERKK